MKRLLFLLFFTTIMVNLLLVSCHTETPTSIDFQNPTGQIELIYTENDTLVFYDYAAMGFYSTFSDSDTTFVTSFEDYSILLDTVNNYTFEIDVQDNQELYKVSLAAMDTIDFKSYEIKSVIRPNSGKIKFTINHLDFVAIPNFIDAGLKFYSVFYDETSNVDSTAKLAVFRPGEGLDPNAFHPLTLLYNLLGKITEVDGAEIDFRDDIGKMSIVQFHSHGWLSCKDEAVALQSIYSNNQYDRELYSISTFGSAPEYTGIDSAYCKDFIKDGAGLEFDVFFDEGQSAKFFFDDFLGINGNNEIYIITPDGETLQFDGHTPDELTEWVITLYDDFFN